MKEIFIKKQMEFFRLAAGNNIAVRMAFEVCRSEQIDSCYAWLFAANVLIEENRRLVQIATAAINLTPPPIIITQK